MRTPTLLYQAAVDRDHLPGDVGRLGREQETDGSGDLFGLADSLHRNQSRDVFDGEPLGRFCLDQSGGDTVDRAGA